MMNADFDYLVDLIRNRMEFTPEQREAWESSLKKIEEDMDKPLETEVKIPKRYKTIKNKDNIFDTKFNFWKKIKSIFKKKES